MRHGRPLAVFSRDMEHKVGLHHKPQGGCNPGRRVGNFTLQATALHPPKPSHSSPLSRVEFCLSRAGGHHGGSTCRKDRIRSTFTVATMDLNLGNHRIGPVMLMLCSWDRGQTFLTPPKGSQDLVRQTLRAEVLASRKAVARQSTPAPFRCRHLGSTREVWHPWCRLCLADVGKAAERLSAIASRLLAERPVPEPAVRRY